MPLYFIFFELGQTRNFNMIMLRVLLGCMLILIPGCSSPKYLYNFGDSSYTVDAPGKESIDEPLNLALSVNHSQPIAASDDRVELAGMVTQRAALHPQVEKNQSKPIVSPSRVDGSLEGPKTTQEPAANKRGWMGITSFLLIVSGLLFVTKWEWVAVGMIVAGITLAIIAKAGRRQARKEAPGVKQKKDNVGSANAGLILLGIVVVVLLVMAIVAASSMFNPP